MSIDLNQLNTILTRLQADSLVLGKIVNDAPGTANGNELPGTVTTRLGDVVKNAQQVLFDLQAIQVVSGQPLDPVLTNTTASFTTAQETKLGGIEALADVTDAVNVEAAGAVMDSEVTNLADVKSFDPANYATAVQGTAADSATQPGDLATVATSGDYTDLVNTPASFAPAAHDQAWSTITATPITLAGYGITNGQPLDAVLTNTTASFTTAQATKLGGVEALADVTDAANVTAAGAVMDSEVTNLAAVKSFDSADYATAAQGGLADTATQPADIDLMVESDVTGVTGADAVVNIMSLTQAEYDAIVTPNSATFYIITDV